MRIEWEAHDHSEQEFLSKGWEENPVRHTRVRREQEVRVSTTNENSSQKDDKKTPFIVLAHM